MANPYPTWTKDVRLDAEQAPTESRIRAPYIGLDWVIYALEQIMDIAAADGTITATVEVIGTWELPFRIGTIYLWDDSGVLRAKASAPSGASDGDRVHLTEDSAGPSY